MLTIFYTKILIHYFLYVNECFLNHFRKFQLENLEESKFDERKEEEKICESLELLNEEYKNLKNKKYNIKQLFNGERKRDFIKLNEISQKIVSQKNNLPNFKYSSLCSNIYKHLEFSFIIFQCILENLFQTKILLLSLPHHFLYTHIYN